MAQTRNNMNRKEFIKQSLLLSTLPLLPSLIGFRYRKTANTYSVRLLRHASLVINFGGKVFIVDPMLSAKGEMEPIQNAGNSTRIPMVDLPINNTKLNKIINDADAILVTHTHRDHWDKSAQNTIPKNKPIFCQPSDVDTIISQGFDNVTPIDVTLILENITIYRTDGQHGTGEIGAKMGKVSGFVLKDETTSVYIAGDTIYCDEVENAITTHKPETIIVNAGGAQFLTGGLITMGIDDIEQICTKTPNTTLIAVHMDTVNHCLVTREILSKAMKEKAPLSRVKIPDDGELVVL